MYPRPDKHGVIFPESNLRIHGNKNFTYCDKKKIRNFSSSTIIVVVIIFKIFICIAPWRSE
jgi:hypothetical protein